MGGLPRWESGFGDGVDGLGKFGRLLLCALGRVWSGILWDDEGCW